MESKKYDKLVNITKKKQTHRYKLVFTSGRGKKGQHKDKGLRGANYYV